MTILDWGREICGYLPLAERREWLISNGIGGYACGTVAGLLTRRYHGLLIAALDPPLGRTLLLTKLDETAIYACPELVPSSVEGPCRRNGRDYPLFANRWADGDVEPTGFRHLERFHMEGTTPVWTFACADAVLEKRIWMQPGANTTYVRYDLRRATAPLSLDIKAIVNYRDHHANTHAGDWRMRVEAVAHGLRVTAFEDAVPFYLLCPEHLVFRQKDRGLVKGQRPEPVEGLSNGAEVTLEHTWYTDYFLAMEDYRGLDAWDDNLYAGHFHAALQPGESLTLVASTKATPNLDGISTYAERRAYEQQLLEQSDVLGSSKDGHADAPRWLQHLILAADQFIVRRSPPFLPPNGGDRGGAAIGGG